jgi:3',5'-cyclic AMP phosphodiesterase CpdA
MTRFCHLSDIHLKPMPLPKRRELIGKRITGYVNWQRKRSDELSRPLLDSVVEDAKSQSPDHFAVTGDLVNLALESEIVAARRWLKDLAPPEQVSLVCGNHDAYVPGALRSIAKHWGPWLFAGTDLKKMPDPPNGWLGFDGLYPRYSLVGDIAFVGVNTAKPTAPLRATGVASDRQMEELERILKRLGAAGFCRVVLIHHPPHAKATHRHKRFIGSQRFRNAVARSGAELVLHGHTHLETIEHIVGLQGPVPVVCVPATGNMPGLKKPPGRYNLFEVTKKASHWDISMTARGINQTARKSGPFEIETLFERRFQQPV